MAILASAESFPFDERKEAEMKRKLDSYLSGAVKYIGIVEKKAAKERSAEYAEGVGLSSFKDAPLLAKQVIAEKEKSLSKEASEFSLKEKINYAVDGYALEQESWQTTSKMLDTAILSVATLGVVSVIASSGEPSVLGASVSVGLMAANITGMAKASLRVVTSPDSPAEEKSAKKYAEVKHAQLALKQLKRMITSPEKAKDKELVNRAFASGMGNPGGMIAALKGKDGR